MRRVFKGGALVALIAILITPAIYAEDPPTPFDPPAARMLPPIGVAAEARMLPPIGIAAEARMVPPIGTQGRIGPPTGGEARIGPPGGIVAPEPATAFDLFWAWLKARMVRPIG